MAKKKKLNKRLVLLISVVIAVGLTFAVIGWVVSRPKDPKYYYDRARRAIGGEKKNYTLAAKMFQTAIVASRDNPKLRNEYRYDYALMCFERIARPENDPGLTDAQRIAVYRSGLALLKTIIQDDPESIPARRKLAEYYWARAERAEQSTDPGTAHAYDLWTSLVEELTAILKLQQDPELYYRRAVAEQYLGKDDVGKRTPALNDYRKAIAISKTGDENLRYRIMLASYLRLLGDKTEAEKEYKEAIKANPKKAQAYLGYSNFLFQEKRDKEALREIDSAITNDSANAMGYIARAKIYSQKKEFDKAIDVLKKAPKDSVLGIDIYNLEGGIYRRLGRLADAAAAYRSGLDAVDRQIAENKNSNAIGMLESAKVQLAIQLAKMMLIISETEKDKTVAAKAMDEAESCNKLLLKLIPNTRAQLKIAGRIAFVRGDFNQARKYMEQARELREEYDLKNRLKQTVDVELTQLLWRIYERNGYPSRAKQELRRLVSLENYGTSEQRAFYLLKLARYELRDGNYQSARNIVNHVLRADRNNKEAMIISKSLDIAQKEEIPGGGSKLDPTSRAMVYRLAENYVIEEQYDKAVESLKRLLKSDPGDKQAMVKLVGLLVEIGEKDQALALIEKAVKDSPDDKDLAVWRNILQADNPEKVFEIQMKASDGIEDTVERNLQKWRLCMSAKHKAEAEKYFKLAEKANPSDIRVIKIAFVTAIQNKNWNRGQEVINRLDKDEKTLREMYLGELLFAQEKYDDAISMLKSVLKERPNLQQVRLLLANCYLKKEDFDKAEIQLRTVVKNDSSNVIALVGLAQLAKRKQNIQDFEKWIRMAYKHNTGKADPFVREAFLTLEVEKNDPQKAILLREKEFRKNKSNLQNAIRLAALYEDKRVNQIDKAQEKYEYVFANVPNRIDFAPFIVSFYSRIGRPAKGHEIFNSLMKTAKTKKDKASVLTAHGDFLLHSGDVSGAEGMYKKAVETDERDSRGYRGLARCYALEATRLERLGKTAKSKSEWNRSITELQRVVALEQGDIRTRKLICYRQIRAERYKEAIDGFRSLLSSNPEDKEASLGIAAAYQSEQELKKALAQLDGIIKKYPRYAEAYASRADVYESDGELKKADVDYREALKIVNNPVWARDRARLNVQMGDTDQALRIYTETIRAFPDYAPAYIGKLGLLIARKDWSQVRLLAEAGMKNFATVPDFAMAMAEVWRLQKQPRKEIEMLKKATEIAPGNQHIIRGYLTALAANKDYTALQAEAEKYIDDPEQAPGVMGILAQANARRHPAASEPLNEFFAALKASGPGDISYVLTLMRQAMGPQVLTANALQLKKIHPNSWEIPYALARADALQGKHSQAIREYSSALGLAKDSRSRLGILFALAASYSALKDYSNVEKTYKKALEIDPNNKAVLNNLAYVLVENLNRLEEALSLSKRAVKLQPGNVNMVDTYAWILARMGKYQKAMSAFNEIRDRAVKNTEILYHIAFVAEKLKKYEVSREYYQQALEGVRMHKNHPLTQEVQQGLKRVKQKLIEE